MFDSVKLNIVKKYIIDFIILISILLISFFIWLLLLRYSNSNANVVKIIVNGTLWGQYSLDTNQEIEVNTEYGHNTIIINDHSVFVSSASCIDKTCIKEGRINNSIQSIICIPNRLSIEIYNGKEESIDGYAY